MESNGASNETVREKRNQATVHALCKRLSLDPQSFTGGTTENDIKSLLSNFQKLTGNEVHLGKIDEMMNWVRFADSFPVDSEACHGVVKGLNEDLVVRSVLLGDGLASSEADIIVFSALHSFIVSLPNSDRMKYPHVMRWMDYIQNSEDFGAIFETILLEKAIFDPPCSKIQGSKNVAKIEVDSKAQKSVDKVEADLNSKRSIAEETVVGDNKASEEKKKLPEAAVEKDKEVGVSLLNIQVGIVRKAWKHPSADSLLVEEIDLGDAKLRQVVSGLAKYCRPEDLMNRRVVLITNMKPGKLREQMSEGLVLCASNQDHTVVEPLLPPEGAKLGERVSFSGHDGRPEDVLNPKKKQLEKITPYLYTDDKGVATFKGIPFMTSGGPCTSCIPNASIK